MDGADQTLVAPQTDSIFATPFSAPKKLQIEPSPSKDSLQQVSDFSLYWSTKSYG